MNRKIILVVVVVTFVVAFLFGYSFRLFYPSSESRDENELTIASLKKEVMGNLSSHLSIIIENSWVEDNKVRCTGTVYWLGGDIVSGTRVCLLITRNQTNSVNAEVVVYGGGLLLPTGTIDSDSLQIPTLGEQVFSFDFSLSCTYSEP